ncbi:MAG: conjugal transfer protein TraX [Oscillospiraceae bacterium]|nr:conjugal transfer protein TraX [Oscillospiraceae bacterium]
MTSFILKWIAIASMLIDHIGASGLIPTDGLPYFVCRSIGRLAFPLFAFMIAEGYFYTKNYKKYIMRLIVFMAISEIPFDLFLRGSFPVWESQSIYVTFTIALAGLYFFDHFAAAGKRMQSLLALLTAAFAAEQLNADYGVYGILIVFIFYFYRDRPRSAAAWFSAVVIVNAILNAVSAMPLTRSVIFSLINIFALFALIPILLYNRKKGYSSSKWQYFFYAFYPVHLIILYFLAGMR